MPHPLQTDQSFCPILSKLTRLPAPSSEPALLAFPTVVGVLVDGDVADVAVEGERRRQLHGGDVVGEAKSVSVVIFVLSGDINIAMSYTCKVIATMTVIIITIIVMDTLSA